MLRKYAKKIIKRLSSNNYHPLNHIVLNAQAMLHNVATIQKQHPGFEIIPVLKSNAYGHGLEQVAEILNDADCNYLAVDGYFEAAKIKDITKHHILVLGYILPDNVPLLDIKRCSFVVQDALAIQALGSLGRPVKIHIELNTGFNRLGLQANEIPGYLEALKKYPGLELEGVMSHLVDADNELDDSFDVKQQELFDDYIERIKNAGFNPKLIHIAQTAGSAKIKSKYANAIRLGIGTYGINPLSPKDPHYSDLTKLQPVLELKSTIIKVIELKKGDKVSYNATFTAPKDMRIGVLPLGYYEGVPRELSNKGIFTYGRKELPVVGRVCMNHTMVSLDKLDLKVGDQVTIISSDPKSPNSVLSMQAKLGLFSYTTVTKLSSSIRRQVIEKDINHVGIQTPSNRGESKG
ncbi:MAG TPA: alanine racemase [Candidatus Saccharimonadales bacterium]|nr:alanine racemase [Candidatus Saccharimonadales bacterium]